MTSTMQSSRPKLHIVSNSDERFSGAFSLPGLLLSPPLPANLIITVSFGMKGFQGIGR